MRGARMVEAVPEGFSHRGNFVSFPAIDFRVNPLINLRGIVLGILAGAEVVNLSAGQAVGAFLGSIDLAAKMGPARRSGMG